MNRGRRIQQALRALDDFRRDVSEQARDDLDCDELEQRLSAALNQIDGAGLGQAAPHIAQTARPRPRRVTDEQRAERN